MSKWRALFDSCKDGRVLVSNHSLKCLSGYTSVNCVQLERQGAEKIITHGWVSQRNRNPRILCPVMHFQPAQCAVQNEWVMLSENHWIPDWKSIHLKRISWVATNNTATKPFKITAVIVQSVDFEDHNLQSEHVFETCPVKLNGLPWIVGGWFTQKYALLTN